MRSSKTALLISSQSALTANLKELLRFVKYYIFAMTANRVIYLINQSTALIKAWRELSDVQKRAVLGACQTAEETDIERIIEEVADGQRRLF